jgi:protein TonB
MSLRAITWIVSLTLHAALGWTFVREYDVSAYAAGGGTDDFVTEQGIAIEGVAMMGIDTETVEAVEAEPMEASEARPEVEEVKAEEAVEETKVITSAEGPEQEELPEEVQEVKPQEHQVATLEQQVVVPVEAKVAASEVKEGGNASATKAYDGKMFAHLNRKMVRPRIGGRVGRVVVRFTISPTGEVIERAVAESSGVPGIDEAALASIDRASPFPPVPAEVATGPIVRTVPIRYTVQ